MKIYETPMFAKINSSKMAEKFLNIHTVIGIIST